MLKESYRLTRQTALQTSPSGSVLWREATPEGHAIPRRLPQRSSDKTTRPNGHNYAVVHSPIREIKEALSPPIRILIVDKQVIIQAGLRSLLAEAQEMLVVGEARHGIDALHLATALRPNVILIDPTMLEIDGIEIIRQLRCAQPDCQIVVLTAVLEEQWVHATVEAGAIGYLLKDVPKLELLRAIRAAACGEPTLHAAAQRILMRQTTRSPFHELTAREIDVLRLLAQGCSNRVIATTLCLTEGTVKGYVSTILAKLQVTDRTQAALYAVKHGLSRCA